MLVAVAVAAVAVVVAFLLFRSLSALRASSAEEVAGLREGTARLEEENARLARELEATATDRDVQREAVADLEGRLSLAEEQLRSVTARQNPGAISRSALRASSRFS